MNFQAEGIDFVAFDEGERILIVSFLRKSLSRVLWTSHKRIDRDAIQELGAILDWLGWLAGYVAQIASIWPPWAEDTAFFSAQSAQEEKLLLGIERTLLIFDYY